jgi:general secretion pathway protein G
MKIDRIKALLRQAAVGCGVCGSSASWGAILAEAILTLAVLGILAIMVCPKMFARVPYAGITSAVTGMASLNEALVAFHSDMGYYPPGTNGLLDLVHQPIGAANWKGPYLEKVPEDPWGRAYIYDCPGKHRASGLPYDLMCSGPPGKNSPINWSSDLTKPMPESVQAQDNAANGGQPIPSETNRTSSAAGSRH